MAKGKIKWHFPDVGGGQGGGFNDAGIDKFKYSASIYRETAQNSIDQWDIDTDEPCTIYYKYKEYESSAFFIDEKIKNVFDKCSKYDAAVSTKGDGKEFYQNSKALLNKNKIGVLSICDYHTKGLHEDPHEKSSAYHRLVVSPGASRQSGMGGGSHGHGQKATFAVSNLRTVFYYSYVNNGIKNFNSKELFIGKTILNMWEDNDGIEKVPVGYHGDVWVDPNNKRKIKTFPLSGEDIPKELVRTNPDGEIPTGTDIHILEPKINRNWRDHAEKEIISNFFGSIEAGFLQIGIQDKSKGIIQINKSNLDMAIMKHSLDAIHYLKALREPVNNGKPFTRKIDKLGTVKLYISQHEGGNQKIALMRKPRMLIQEISRKVLSNFAGVLLVDDETGNQNLRLAENPRHDKIQKYLMREHFPPEVDFIGELWNFIDDTLEGLKGSSTHEKLEIPGLGNLLPGNKPKDKKGDSVTDNNDNAPNQNIINAKIVKVTEPRLKAPRVSKVAQTVNVIEDEDGTGRRRNRKKKKIRIRKKYKKGDGKEVGIIPSIDLEVRTFLIKRGESETSYYVKAKLLKKANGYIGFTFIGEDDIRVVPKISSIKYKDDSQIKPEYKIESNLINFGELTKGDTIVFEIIIKDNIPASLGVLG